MRRLLVRRILVDSASDLIQINNLRKIADFTMLPALVGRHSLKIILRMLSDQIVLIVSKVDKLYQSVTYRIKCDDAPEAIEGILRLPAVSGNPQCGNG